jgi:hypothetical protein
MGRRVTGRAPQPSVCGGKEENFSEENFSQAGNRATVVQSIVRHFEWYWNPILAKADRTNLT